MKHFNSLRALKEKQLFVGTLADLLHNGFTFMEAVAVMKRSQRFDEGKLRLFAESLAQGASVGQCFAGVGLLPQELAQIQLAEAHGNLAQTLKGLEGQLRLTIKQRQELRKVLSYPAILLLFMVGMVIAMRQILLPQLLATGMLQTDHIGIQIIQAGPFYLLLGFSGILGSLVILRRYYRQQGAVRQAALLRKLPFIGRFYQLYITTYFSLEWGKLFQEGLEMREIVTVMQATDKASLMGELAGELAAALAQGQELAEKIAGYPFFTSEFASIVFQGTAKGKLGEELLIYSQLTRVELQRRVETVMQWIQPVVFLVIGLLVVSVYGALFLPLYSNLEQLY